MSPLPPQQLLLRSQCFACRGALRELPSHPAVSQPSARSLSTWVVGEVTSLAPDSTAILPNALRLQEEGTVRAQPC